MEHDAPEVTPPEGEESPLTASPYPFRKTLRTAVLAAAGLAAGLCLVWLALVAIDAILQVS